MDEADEATRDALAGRLFSACIGALDLVHVYIGDRLGLYRVLTERSPCSSAELAAGAGIHERYAREWLEHQAVAGIVAVDSAKSGESRRFSMPEGHAEVLLDEESLSYLAPLALGVVGVARAAPDVLDAFRTGKGIPYSAYGDDVRGFISRINRPMFLKLLGREWFPGVPGLVERLEADPAARVADVGCGTGWSSVAIARAFPKVSVTGLDLDSASIAEARANARGAGVAERVLFEVRDASDPGLAGHFDLVCAFETLHDMCDPIGALRAMRALRIETGTVLLVDERVADEFTVEVEEGERFQWGWSALHCLPCAMTDPPAAGIGTILRAPALAALARQAGFADVEVLPVENDFWRFYRLVG